MALIRLFAYYRILVGDDRMQNGFVFLYMVMTRSHMMESPRQNRKSDCFFGIAIRGVAADSFVPVILLDGDVGIVFARIQ